MDKKYDVTTFILRRRRVPNIADIIKIATIFIIFFSKKTLLSVELKDVFRDLYFLDLF